MLNLSVFAPVKNEVYFVKAWCEFAKSVSDDIHVCDTGSTDGTLDALRDCGIDPYRWAVKEKYAWPEGRIRNALIDRCKREWVLFLDMDELLGEAFRSFPLYEVGQDFVSLVHYSFWMSPNLLRLRPSFGMEHRRWYPSRKHKLFRNRPYIRFKNTGDHAPLEWHGLGKSSPWLSTYNAPLGVFHYHHCLMRPDHHARKEDYAKTGVRCQTYFGPHPKETEHYTWFRENLLWPSKINL